MFPIIIQRNRSYKSALIIIIFYYCYYYYKKGDVYATPFSWLCAKVSFAILQSALLCKIFKNQETDCENSSWSWFRECCCYYNVELLFFKVTFNFSFYILLFLILWFHFDFDSVVVFFREKVNLIVIFLATVRYLVPKAMATVAQNLINTTEIFCSLMTTDW